jgi:small conductance mechanosensitive channel
MISRSLSGIILIVQAQKIKGLDQMNIFIQDIFSQLQAIFSPTALSAHFAQILSKLIVGAVVLAAFYLTWLLISPVLKVVFKRSGTNEMTSTFLSTLAKYTLLIIGFVTALDSMGIKVGAVLASLGIAGLTIGFAARDSLSNIISGILIFLDRPFVIGDIVEIEGFYGRVEKITLRSTRIITSDGKMLAVPNTEIINKTVASYTNFPNLRLDIQVAIGVNEDIEKTRQVLFNLLADKPEFLAEPIPRVVVTSLNDYNVLLELQVWLKDERTHIENRYKLREEVFNALHTAGIEMPFETFSITPVQVTSSQDLPKAQS